MSTNSLTDFKTNFNGGTRANRFLIEGDFPGGSFTRVHVRSAVIPTTSSKTIEYPYMGRKWIYPGEKNIENWTFTVLDDVKTEDANMWKQFQSWQNKINNHETNVSQLITLTGAPYKADQIKVKHLDINGDETKPLKTYILEGCWPSSIKPIRFNMSTTGQFNLFQVTIMFDSFRILDVTPAGFN